VIALAPLDARPIAGIREDAPDICGSVREHIASVLVLPLADPDTIGRSATIGVNQTAEKELRLALDRHPALPGF
jgi:hypothetical protein